LSKKDESLEKLKILFEGKARGGEKAQCTFGVHEHFSPTSNAAIGRKIGFSSGSGGKQHER
jgi:hypothetical protein